MSDTVRLIDLEVHRDDRGHLVETFNRTAMTSLLGHGVEFVQDNLSVSGKWVLRGLHYQLPPNQQGKLVMVAAGAIYDVAVDIRRSSQTYGTWSGHHMDANKAALLWVPPGFAHGFLSLAEGTSVSYKLTSHQVKESERVIKWDDPRLGIEWPLQGNLPVMSARDLGAPGLDQADVFE